AGLVFGSALQIETKLLKLCYCRSSRDPLEQLKHSTIICGDSFLPVTILSFTLQLQKFGRFNGRSLMLFFCSFKPLQTTITKLRKFDLESQPNSKTSEVRIL